MQIHISIVQTEPLTGTAATPGCDPRPFDGWLELLRAISELVDAAAPPAPPRAGPAASLRAASSRWRPDGLSD